jgi:hypothetical protein
MEAPDMRRLAAAAAAAATLLTTACGHPFVPASVGTPAADQPAAGVMMTRPFTTGVDLYVTRDYSLAETETLGQRDIAWIVRTLRVQALGIAWDLSVPNDTSDVVRAEGPVAASVADIRALTQIAQAYHLQVEYRVLFRIAGRDGASEYMRPARPPRWFASLLSAETPYLKLAAREKVGEFIVGTELATLEGSPEWKPFFKAASRVYPGQLSYATWGGNFFSPHRALPPVAEYGVTAYPDIRLPDSASVAQLTAAWTSFLRRAPAAVLQRTAIDEIGIPAEAGAYRDPWAWNNQHGRQDDQVQARWFEAACAAAVAAHMRGIFFWNVNLIDDPEHPYASLVKIEGRPQSEAAIRNCGGPRG